MEKRELSNCSEGYRLIFALKRPLRNLASDSTKQIQDKNT